MDEQVYTSNKVTIHNKRRRVTPIIRSMWMNSSASYVMNFRITLCQIRDELTVLYGTLQYSSHGIYAISISAKLQHMSGKRIYVYVPWFHVPCGCLSSWPSILKKGTRVLLLTKLFSRVCLFGNNECVVGANGKSQKHVCRMYPVCATCTMEYWNAFGEKVECATFRVVSIARAFSHIDPIVPRHTRALKWLWLL